MSVLAAQSATLSIVLVVVTALTTAGAGYFFSTVQFRRQQQVDHARWLRQERLTAYRQLIETVRSSGELAEIALELDYSGHASKGVTRSDAPMSIQTAMAAAQLVGGLQVTTLLQQIDMYMWEGNQEGGSPNLMRRMAATVADLEAAMREEVQGDLVT